MKIRIKFSKQGPVKFIGHLDMMRYFQKAMRRADVAIKYSEGFSPHQIMSFASPLGVGLTSNGEYLDIEVSQTEDSKTMISRLNDTMAEGVHVLSYRLLPEGSKNAMSIVAAADYTLTFRDSCRPQDLDSFTNGLMEFYKQEQILVTKKTKKSEKVMDIKPMVLNLSVQEDTIAIRVAAGSAENLKPELFMQAYYQSLGLEYPEFAMQIQREEVYDQELTPLEDLGEDIE